MAGGRAAGFTLAEVMVSMAVVLIVMTGILATHLFGLRLFEITKAKLGASDDARAAVNRMVEEIRAAKILRLGSGNLSAFTQVVDGTPQLGSAIQIHATTNTNSYVRYFWDGADRKLKRATNSAPAATIIAHAVSNQMVFSAENFTGTVLTNNENNRVIGLTLQFYQLQYPAVSVGPGHHYDSYQLRAKITRRALE